MGKPKGRKADFQKIKLKIGRRLPKGLNVTDTSFKSKKIVIRNQILKDASDGPTSRKRGIKELLSRLQHYNPGTRHESLIALKDLLSSNPNIIKSHIAGLIERVCELMVDKDVVVRKAVIAVLNEMMKNVPHDLISPFFPIITSYLCCAMTHILIDVQKDSLKVLDLLLFAFPGLTVNSASLILKNFLDQISSDKGESRARVLLVKPGEKLTSQKWRLEVLQRIQRFLLALLENWEVTSNFKVNDKFMEIEWDCISPLSIKLYRDGLKPRKPINAFSLYQCSDDSTPNKDSKQARSFMSVLLPLMVETWVEASPEKTSHKSGSILSRDAADILDCVLHVIRSLAQWMEKIHNDKPDKDCETVEWLQEVFFNDFVNYFTAEFPYSPFSTMEHKKGKHTSQISFVSLNLMICEILVLLRPEMKSISPNQYSLFEVAIEYISMLLITEKVQGTNIFTIVRIIQHITKNNPNHCFTEKLLEDLWKLYKKWPSSRKDRLAVDTLFMELITSPQFYNLLKLNCLSSWLELLPSNILNAVDNPERLLGLLEKASNISSCRFPAFTKGLQSCDSQIIALLEDLPFSEKDSLKAQRLLMNIIYSLPTISESAFRQLAAVLGSPKVDVKNVNYLVQNLSIRFQKSEDSGFLPGHYFCLLLCIQFGVLKHEAQQVKQSFVSNAKWQTFQHSIPCITDFVVVPTDYQVWNRHQQLSSKAIRYIWDFSESSEFQQSIFTYIKLILEQFRYIPAHAVSGILALVSPILRETEMEDNLDNDFLFRLYDLVLSTLITASALTLSTKDKTLDELKTADLIMDIAIEFLVDTECIDRVSQIFQRNIRGLKNVSEVQGQCLGMVLSKLLKFEEPEGDSLHSMRKALQILQSLTDGHRSRSRWWNELVYDFKMKSQMSANY